MTSWRGHSSVPWPQGWSRWSLVPWVPHVPHSSHGCPWCPAAVEPAQGQGSLQRATGPFLAGTGWTKPCCVPQCPTLCQAARWQGLAVPGLGDTGGLGSLRPGSGWATLWGPCVFPTNPKSHPLACPWVGWGGNTTWASAQMLPGLCGGQVHPKSAGHSS